MAQFLVGCNFKTTHISRIPQNFRQPFLNMFSITLNFQCKWSTDVEMTVA